MSLKTEVTTPMGDLFVLIPDTEHLPDGPHFTRNGQGRWENLTDSLDNAFFFPVSGLTDAEVDGWHAKGGGTVRGITRRRPAGKAHT